MTRTGKIARLPRAIRDQLNQRLNDGQPGNRLVAWLNTLSEVRRILAADFDGRSLNEQNLSDWKAGGYLDWLARQDSLVQTNELAADSRELATASDGKLTDHLTNVLAARYTTALAQWDRDTTSPLQEKLRMLHSLCQDIVKLRRADHHATRLGLVQEQWKDQQVKTETEILTHFKEWIENEDVREWISKEDASPEEQESRMGVIFDLKSQPAPSAPKAGPAPNQGKSSPGFKPNQAQSSLEIKPNQAKSR